jgi:hypothetical protein
MATEDYGADRVIDRERTPLWRFFPRWTRSSVRMIPSAWSMKC